MLRVSLKLSFFNRINLTCLRYKNANLEMVPFSSSSFPYPYSLKIHIIKWFAKRLLHCKMIVYSDLYINAID